MKLIMDFSKTENGKVIYCQTDRCDGMRRQMYSYTASVQTNKLDPCRLQRERERETNWFRSSYEPIKPNNEREIQHWNDYCRNGCRTGLVTFHSWPPTGEFDFLVSSFWLAQQPTIELIRKKWLKTRILSINCGNKCLAYLFTYQSITCRGIWLGFGSFWSCEIWKREIWTLLTKSTRSLTYSDRRDWFSFEFDVWPNQTRTLLQKNCKLLRSTSISFEIQEKKKKKKKKRLIDNVLANLFRTNMQVNGKLKMIA